MVEICFIAFVLNRYDCLADEKPVDFPTGLSTFKDDSAPYL